jgi:hypothetical protein
MTIMPAFVPISTSIDRERHENKRQTWLGCDKIIVSRKSIGTTERGLRKWQAE